MFIEMHAERGKIRFTKGSLLAIKDSQAEFASDREPLRPEQTNRNVH